MSGYGRSTVSSTLEHYSLENVNRKMAELLSLLGNDKAVWVGHDWGAVAVWCFAAVRTPWSTVNRVSLTFGSIIPKR
jgi:pimeloyl-ACP methyl ester carboxylesterase